MSLCHLDQHPAGRRRCCVCRRPTCSACLAEDAGRCRACPDPADLGRLAVDAASDWLEGVVLELLNGGIRDGQRMLATVSLWFESDPDAPAVLRLGLVPLRDLVSLAWSGIWQQMAQESGELQLAAGAAEEVA